MTEWDLWALCIYDLGLTEEQFLQLTFKEIDVLCERKKLDDRRTEYHAALITCMIYNVNRRKGKRALTPKDFMSHERAPSMTDAEMKAKARQIAQAYSMLDSKAGGKKCRKGK
jgi:hypothetical protein